MSFQLFKIGSPHLVKEGEAALVQDQSVRRGLGFQLTRNHPSQGSYDRSKRIRSIVRETETHRVQVVAHLRRRKPFAFVGAKYEPDGIQKTSALLLHFLNFCLKERLLVFRKQRECCEDKLLEFCDLAINFVALLHELGMASNQFGEH